MGTATNQTGLLLPAASLCWRELVRFLRQRHRIVGALATPIVFWLLIGGGMGHHFQTNLPGNGDYMTYFFPGTVIMILLFTAIFSTISIIEDRREGFLQSVLVAPVSTQSIVLGKILGGTILAAGQGLIFLALGPLAGVHFTLLSFIMSAGVLFIVSFALTGLGFCIAWRMSSTQGFHAIMNLFLMPMWFLSGSMFPGDGMLGKVMAINPLTYGVAGLRRAIYWGNVGAALPSWETCAAVSIGFAAAMFVLSSLIATGRVSADLQ